MELYITAFDWNEYTRVIHCFSFLRRKLGYIDREESEN